MQVPFVDLKPQYAALRDEVNAAIMAVVEASHFVGGEAVERFEQDFAAYVGATYAVGVGNGTDALTLALRAGGIGPGDEVLVPANTFIASAEAVSNVGARPVFVDIDPTTFHLDPEATARAITPRTRAILPVHLYGRAVDLRPFVELAAVHQLLIVEDCAQAHGAEFAGKVIGSAGRLTCFSFYPGKNLGAYGDGGAITTSDPELNTRLRMLRDHGSARKYEHVLVGYNSRLDAMQAAVLSVKLRHLNDWNAARRRIARSYAAALTATPILPPQIPPEGEHVFHLFVVRCTQRDALQRYLAERGIGTGIHYPVPLHLTGAYQPISGQGRGSHPAAEALADEILSLPIFAELSDAQLEATLAAIGEFISTASPKAIQRRPTASLA